MKKRVPFVYALIIPATFLFISGCVSELQEIIRCGLGGIASLIILCFFSLANKIDEIQKR